MMHLHFVFVGKTAFQEMETGINRYLDRLKHYLPTQVHHVKAERILAKSEESAIREREGERILKLVGKQGYLVVLDQHGRQMDSPGLANFLSGIQKGGTSQLWMVIGGPLGVSPQVLERADLVLSLSRMTFPHDLARLMVVEQIYRALTILKGEPYHK
jgi:23S rRNA (pseudouridine1915-N3)-methyltransferase